MSVRMYLKLCSNFVAILFCFILIIKTESEESRTYGGTTCQVCAQAEETRYTVATKTINDRLSLCYFHPPSSIVGQGAL